MAIKTEVEVTVVSSAVINGQEVTEQDIVTVEAAGKFREVNGALFVYHSSGTDKAVFAAGHWLSAKRVEVEG